MTPPPLPRVADCGEIDTFDPDFLGVRLQNSGEHEQGAPRPARVYAHLLRQV